MTITVLEYAQLSNAVYTENKPEAAAITPAGWRRIYADYRPSNWGFGAALYAKKTDQQTKYVIAFRGTENRMDVLKDIFFATGQNPADQAENFLQRILIHLEAQRPTLPPAPSAEAVEGEGNNEEDQPIVDSFKQLMNVVSQREVDGYSPINYLGALSSINAERNEEQRHEQAHALRDTAIAQLATQLHSFGDVFEQIRRIASQHSLSVTGHSLGAIMAEVIAALSNLPCVSFDSPGCKTILEKTYAQSPHLTPSHYNHIQGFLAAPHLINTCDGQIGRKYRFKLPHTTPTSLNAINGASSSTVRGALVVGAVALVAAPFTGGASLAATGYAFATAVGAKAVEIGSGAVRNSYWLYHQHILMSMITYIETRDEAALKEWEVMSWPTRWQRQLEAPLKRTWFSFIPFNSNNRTVFNFNDETIDERQIENMPGYQIRHNSRPG